jgi:DNA-binding PadR family transcriptional regulator
MYGQPILSTRGSSSAMNGCEEMGRASIDLARGRSRALRGATLALIVERGGHGYELAHRLNRRLGPTWRIDPRQIYPILDELVSAGLATSVEEPNPDRPRQPRIVYHATEQAPEMLRRWMRSRVEKEPVRPDVLARIGCARSEDAAELLNALDDYEHELLCLLEANDDVHRSARSWSTLVLSVVRAHTDAHLQAEFRWLVDARRRIREFAESGRGA